MSADEAAEAASRYAEELEELTFNSKPIITSLSMIAEEFLPVSAAIVAVIEKKIAAAAADKKLPVLYLLEPKMHGGITSASKSSCTESIAKCSV